MAPYVIASRVKPVNGTRYQKCWKQEVLESRIELEELKNSIPGLKHVLNRKKSLIFKLNWFLILTASFFACGYQVFDRFRFFISNTIDSRVSVQRNQTVKFPSITLCPPRLNYPLLMPHLKQIADELKIEVCGVRYTQLLNKNWSLAEIHEKYNTEELIHPAEILTKSGDKSVYMKTLVNKTVTTTLGTCITYTLMPFRNDDIVVSIVIMPYDTAKMCLSHTSAYFSFHNDDDDFTYKISVTSFRQTFLSDGLYRIQAKRFKALNRTDAPCSTSSVVAQCERKCVEDLVRKENITCRLPYMKYHDLPPCKTEQESGINHMKVYAQMINISYPIDCRCPVSCDETKYTMILKASGLQYPGIYFYFDDNNIDVIEQYYSYTFIPFVCDIGGNIGLYLGLCIPAIVDVMQTLGVHVYKKIL